MARRQRKPQSDPHAAREARKYDNPIPSREFILETLAGCGKPLNHEQLARELGLEGEEPFEALRRRLNAMERDGQLLRNRRGGYGPVQKMDLVRGRVVGHRDGFGFLIPDEGGEDVFLSARAMRRLIHGDRAVVRIDSIDHRGRREGSVVEVLERSTTEVVGRYRHEAGVGFVSPDNARISQEIIVPDELRGGAQEGQIVQVALVAQPTPRTPPVGKVVEVLGDHMAPGMEIDVAVRANGLPHAWPEVVEGEIAALTPEVPEAAKVGREDIRHLPLVTIDGADARDFDDAVYCEKRRGGGWRLLVAIADVSHYVAPETALDDEALNRGNSVYFPERVIPMLPEVLSNGLCSLNPEVDRLCMVCEMTVSRLGRVTGARFFEGVMRSHARLIYDDVAAMLVAGDEALRERHAGLLPHLDNLHALYRALRSQREKRGAIDFDTTETRIVFGPERKIERIVPVVRNVAHMLIEECMLAANVSAAEFLGKHKIPTLYRVHDGPGAQKLEELRTFLSELGLQLRGGDKPQPADYALLLEQVQGRPDAHLIQTVLLRSLSQAVYQPQNSGHFGLAFKAYTHFTSPIRRYPDLLVHRAIRHLLRELPREDYPYSDDRMTRFGEHCSTTERRADEATRDAVDWLKCEFMLDRVGDEFNGIISGVTSFGVFVELEQIYVQGLVHITSLADDYYHFDPAHHRLKGERLGRVYRLGDPIRVQVARVNLDDRKIDFEPLSTPPTGARRGPGKAAAGGEEGGPGEEKGRRSGRGRRGKRTGEAVQAESAGPGTEAVEADAAPAEPKKKSRSGRSRRRRGGGEAKSEPVAPKAESAPPAAEPATPKKKSRSGRSRRRSSSSKQR